MIDTTGILLWLGICANIFLIAILAHVHYIFSKMNGKQLSSASEHGVTPAMEEPATQGESEMETIDKTGSTQQQTNKTANNDDTSESTEVNDPTVVDVSDSDKF